MSRPPFVPVGPELELEIATDSGGVVGVNLHESSIKIVLGSPLWVTIESVFMEDLKVGIVFFG